MWIYKFSLFLATPDLLAYVFKVSSWRLLYITHFTTCHDIFKENLFKIKYLAWNKFPKTDMTQTYNFIERMNTKELLGQWKYEEQINIWYISETNDAQRITC